MGICCCKRQKRRDSELLLISIVKGVFLQLPELQAAQEFASQLKIRTDEDMVEEPILSKIDEQMTAVSYLRDSLQDSHSMVNKEWASILSGKKKYIGVEMSLVRGKGKPVISLLDRTSGISLNLKKKENGYSLAFDEVADCLSIRLQNQVKSFQLDQFGSQIRQKTLFFPSILKPQLHTRIRVQFISNLPIHLQGAAKQCREVEDILKRCKNILQHELNDQGRMSMSLCGSILSELRPSKFYGKLGVQR